MVLVMLSDGVMKQQLKEHCCPRMFETPAALGKNPGPACTYPGPPDIRGHLEMTICRTLLLKKQGVTIDAPFSTIRQVEKSKFINTVLSLTE